MITVTKHRITEDVIGKVCLVGNTKSGYEKIKRMKDGRDVCIEIKTKINPRYFRLLHGLAKCLSVHSREDSYYSGKDAHIIIKSLQFEIGDTYLVLDPKTGEMVMQAESLSFTNKEINENYDAIEKVLFSAVA